MVDFDIILAKVANIQRCLKRVEEKTGFNPESLENLDVQEIFILNLQRAIQSSIDIAAHVVADEGLGLPGPGKENFSLLEKAGIISQDVSSKMQSMVGFRNIVVLEYQNINLDILKSVLQNNVKDFVDFYTQVLNYFNT
ncbi:MAG: type VII toxin-antitoxin system HepT family RNase toxin [Candidatus Kryptoniota bacterium]